MTAYPSWTPTSEAGIERWLASGDVEETHYFEAKRLIGTSKSEKLEARRDIAAMAIDGGVIAVGIDELDGGRFALAPQPLDQLTERIDQMAQMGIDPPVHVTTTVIRSAADQSQGYAWVHVSASGQAPHQVDGKYWGRSDKTKMQLSDAEVTRYHQVRASERERADRLLDQEIARSPVPESQRRYGYCYMVAEPVINDATRASRFLRQPTTPDWLRETSQSDRGMPHLGSDSMMAPSVTLLTSIERRSSGYGRATHSIAHNGRQLTEDVTEDDAVLDVEWTNSGGIRILASPVSGAFGRHSEGLIKDGLAAIMSRRLAHWVKAYADALGYFGPWLLGIHMDHLSGRHSAVYAGQQVYLRPTSWDAEIYREVTTLSHQTIVDRPWSVADRLVGQLTWTLGTREHYSRYLDAPEA